MDLSKEVRVEGNKNLLHQVHENIAKCINICIANDGKHFDDVI